MGFWNTLAKGLGIAAAPFTGGASLAPVLISAGAGLGGAYLASRAQNKASQRQAQAAREALRFEQDVYGRDLRDYERGLGSLQGTTTARLGDLLAARPTPYTAPGIYGGGQVTGAFTPRPQTAPVTLGALLQARPAQPGLVPLTAPDGSTRMVTPERAAYYQQKWAGLGGGR